MGFHRISKIDNKKWSFGVRAGVRAPRSCSFMTVMVERISTEVNSLPRLYRTARSSCEVLFCDYES